MNGEMATWLAAILPEIGLFVLAVVILVFDLVWQDQRCRNLGWMTALGVLAVMGLSLVFARPAPDEARLMWGGMLRLDEAGFVFRLVFLAAAGITALFAMQTEGLCEHGEFYVLLLVSALGMTLMVSAADLIMLFLSIETATIPLYVLAGFLTREQKSIEAGVKYLLYGAFASALMLYGFSLLYGFSGTTQLYQIADLLQSEQIPPFALTVAALLVLAGLGFKISAAPFHFWAPDVYEGAPTPAVGFISTASKTAGFGVLMRLLVAVFPGLAPDRTVWIAVLAVTSMVVGNFLALSQRNIKRLLAYSSIAQAGYMLIGVAAGSAFGYRAVIYYLISYLVTNLAAFGVVSVVGNALQSDEISAYAGLSRRSPGLAYVLLVVLLSLGGIPPLAGFFGKLLVFGAAIETGLLWLAILGAINSVVALYYYLTVLRIIFQPDTVEDERPVRIAWSWKLALTICTLAVVLLGVWMAPVLEWSGRAATALLFY